MTFLSRRLVGGWTDLHVAAEAGDLAKVRQAVQKNPSDLDKTTRDKQTALHLAAANALEAVLGELLDRRAKTTLQDEAGRTPLHAAAIAGRERNVAVLLGKRNCDTPDERSRLLSLRDKNGHDALMAAVAAGQAGSVKALLQCGADPVRSADQSGAGVMLLAVRLGHLSLLPLLAPAVGLEQRDPSTGGTPLHLAATTGNLQAIEWLLRAGASSTTRDNAGCTPLEAARAAGQTAACRLLREGPPGAPGTPAQAGVGAPAPAPSGGGAQGHDLYAPAGGGCYPGAGGQAAAVAQASADAAAAGPPRLQIPQSVPAPVMYPQTPAGAGVYF